LKNIVVNKKDSIFRLSNLRAINIYVRTN